MASGAGKSLLKVRDLLHVRMAAPDLEEAERFLIDFGLVTVERTPDRLYSRGTDAGAWCHVVEKGEPRLIGSAFLVDDRGQLEAAARIEGAGPIEPTGEPGGGERVRLTDPNGFSVDIIHGIESLPALVVEEHRVNTAFRRDRRDGQLYRRPPGPAHVRRLGHFVLSTPDLERTRQWYREVLGLVGTEDIFAGEEDNIVASFSRLARGDEYVDHHVFMTHKGARADLNHLGFEVLDADDLFFGHYYMKDAGLRHRWGVGRHRLGSQIYNQWFDPWNRGYEHWTDTDVLNEQHELALVPAAEALKSQWGDAPPVKFE